jgi:hypothetical protein
VADVLCGAPGGVERCTETRQDVPRVSLASAYATASARPRSDVQANETRRRGPTRWAAVLAVALVLVGGEALFQKSLRGSAARPYSRAGA